MLNFQNKTLYLVITNVDNTDKVYRIADPLIQEDACCQALEASFVIYDHIASGQGRMKRPATLITRPISFFYLILLSIPTVILN